MIRLFMGKKLSTWIDVLDLKRSSASDIIAFRYMREGEWVDVTYEEFYNSVYKLAKALVELGLKKNESVCIIGTNSYAWEVADKAIMCAGGISIGIDVQNYKNIVQQIKKTRSPHITFFDDQCNTVEFDQSFLQENFNSIISLNTFCEIHPSQKSNDLFQVGSLSKSHLPDVKSDDIATILFTSGSTGDTKGVPWSHKQIMIGVNEIYKHFTKQIANEVKITIAWAPLYLGTGRILSASSFCFDVTQYIVSDAKEIFKITGEISPTFLIVVPRMLEKLYAEFFKKLNQKNALFVVLYKALLLIQKKLINLKLRPLTSLIDWLFFKKIRENVFGSRIQFLISGSAPVSKIILEFFDTIGAPTFEVYGQTECAALVALNSPQKCRYGSVGLLSSCYEYKISEDSELWLRSPAVTPYYEGHTHSNLDKSGYFATGDLIRIEDDYAYIIGRKKEIIKTSTGLRISPSYIEGVYQVINGIEQIVVIGNGRKFISALVYANPSHPALASVQNLKQYFYNEFKKVEHQLPESQRIKKFTLLNEPLSFANGEITSSLKYRRFEIEKRHAQIINEMYSEI